MHLLIAYKYLVDHNDPLFEEFTYGDINARARRLKTSLQKGDYVFFHMGIGGKKFITAYYVVDRVLDTEIVVKDKEIIEKYKNPHIERFLSGKAYEDDVLIFGDTSKSRILEQDEWILFDRALAEKLSLNIVFHDHRTENQDIVSATRQYRNLTDEDVNIILNEISIAGNNVSLESHKYSPLKQSTKVEKQILPEKIYERPLWIINLLNDIEKLRSDREHKERAHESLVESFYELIGFSKFVDIKHRQGRIDISIEYQGKTVIVNEVKKDWNLSYKDKTTMIQAYNYSLESGARYVVITNGDYYAIFDKDKGRSYESNFIGDFKLSRLEKEDFELMEMIKKENIQP